MAKTKLQAVNTMLSAIGQVPVLAISDSPVSDSAIASAIVDEYSEELQSEGYDFNTDTEVEIEPQANGRVFIGDTVFRAWNYYPYPNYTVRGNQLYNLDDQTDRFESTVTINRINKIPFEDLPEVLQRYVIIRSARVFANRVVGAGEINAYTQEDEARARLAWLNAVSEDMQLNVMSTRRHHKLTTYRPSEVLRRSSRYL